MHRGLDGVPADPVGGVGEFATTLFGVNPASTAASAATLRRVCQAGLVLVLLLAVSYSNTPAATRAMSRGTATPRSWR